MGGSVIRNGDWVIGDGEEGKLDESDPFDYWGRALKASAGESLWKNRGSLKPITDPPFDGIRLPADGATPLGLRRCPSPLSADLP